MLQGYWLLLLPCRRHADTPIDGGGEKAYFRLRTFGRQCSCLKLQKSAVVGILMKPLIFALCVFSAFGGLSAQTAGWQPSPGHTQCRYGRGRGLMRGLSRGRRSLRRGRTSWLLAGHGFR